MKARFFRPALAAALLSSTAMAAELAPNRVVLSSGGLAEISADVPVSGRTTISFDAPLAQIDDVLKSLVITGQGVRVVSADLAGREPLSDTFTALPLDPSDLENSITLLNALKGVPVEVQRMDRTVSGIVIGVRIVGAGDEAPEDGGRQIARLSVVTDAGAIEHIDVDEATRIVVLDQAMREAVLKALSAIASDRSADRRTIDVTLEGPAASTATLTYVVGAPVWKPTWRVVLPQGGGDARFQGWAVLENRTGMDWNGVSLTLSSGTPVALHQSLYESVTIRRPEAPLQVGRRLRPDMDRGVMPEEAEMAAGAAAEPAPMAALARTAEAFTEAAPKAGAAMDEAFGGAVASGVPVAATETLAAATFRVPGAVDLDVGRSLTLPFFDGEARAERVSIYQPGVSDRHPVAAVRVENASDVTLPGGIVTVYEEGVGFVGDAEFAGAAPGEERVLPYALDTKVRISRDVSSDSAIGSARAADGFLVVEYGRVQKTTYDLQGDANAPRTILIEHIANPGWNVEADAEIEGRDGERVRLDVPLAAGERRNVTVTETTVDAQQWSLWDAPDQIILELLAIGDRLDPKLRGPLSRIVEVRALAAEQERRIARVDERIERIRQDQERVRRNLEAVDRNGELGRTYLERLQRQETEMAALEEERDAASSALDAARAELANLVRQLTL